MLATLRGKMRTYETCTESVRLRYEAVCVGLYIIAKIKMKKAFISITLLPNKEVNSRVLSLNKKLGQKIKITPIDPNDNEFAHISIYNATFPDHNLPDIKNILSKIFGGIDQIEIIPEKITSKSKFISIVFKKSNELKDLQEVIVSELNPLREGIIQSKYIDQAEFYSPEELLNANMYGYPFCKDQFSPHMTIAIVENLSDTKQAIEELVWQDSIGLNKASMRILFTNELGEKDRETNYFVF
jgi:2'-5' RNA ligase